MRMVIYTWEQLKQNSKRYNCEISSDGWKDSVYVPGWDCHGLPIEWKIEEQYKK